MVQAVVLGANGYIGNAVAVELVSRGYTVYGVVRSGDDKVVRRLRAQEIVPVVASITASDVSALDSYLTRASVVIDATSQPGGSVDVPRALVRRIEEHAARSQRIVHFLYTSGCLVFDHSADGATLDETSPHNEQHPRSVFTRELTDTASPVFPHVRSTVLIPAWVYGQSSGQYLSQLSFFPSATTPSPVTQYGNPDAVWPWIHVTDLARAYADIVDCGDSRVHGQVFILTDNSTYATRRQIATVLARAAGYKGEIVFAPGLTDPFSLMLEKSIPMFTQKLQLATGWKPRYGPLTDAALAKRVVDAQAAANAK